MAANDKRESGRKFFRIPVDDPSKVSITIAAKHFNVVNVAPGGVGIYLDHADTFAQGEKITDIVLTIDDVSCDITGNIAHISPEDMYYLCGIELSDMNQETSALLQRFVDNHKASLFSCMPDF